MLKIGSFLDISINNLILCVKDKNSPKHTSKMEKIEEEIEIDLIDLLGRLLIKWKACLMFALLGAFCLTLAYNYRNQSTNEFEYDETKTEEIRSQLPTIEVREVEYVYQLYSTYIEEATRQKDYIDNSVLLGLSSNSATVLTRTYYINTSEADVVSIISMSINNEEVNNRICKYFGEESDLDYVNNWVSVVNITPTNIILFDEAGNQVNTEYKKFMAVTVYGRDIETCINLQNIIENYINELAETLELNDFGLQIEKLSEYEESNAKKLIDDRYKQILSNIDQLKVLSKKYEDDLKTNLNDTQMEYFNQLKLKDEYVKRDGDVSYQSIVKQAVLGFLCGAILYAFLFVMLPYIMDGRIKSSDDLEMIGIRCLQEVSLTKSTTAKIDIIKRIGEKISYQRCREQGETEDVLNMLSTEIKIRLNKAGISEGKVFLSSDDNAISRGFGESLVEILQKDGVIAKVGDPEEGSDLFGSLLESQGVLIMVVIDHTKRKKLYRIINLCRDNKISILGSVAIKHDY